MNQRQDTHPLNDDLLAERLRQLRKQAGLSQKALAERLGISGPAIAQWETGRHRPDLRWLPKLASLLNCQISDLRPDLLHPLAGTASSSVAATLQKTPDTTSNQPHQPQVIQQPFAAFGADTDTEIDWSQHTDLVRLDAALSTGFRPTAPLHSMENQASSVSDQDITSTSDVASEQETQALILSPLQLRRARQQRRLERRELAALLHVDAFKIQQWEQGSATPNAWQSHRLAQVLGLRQAQLRSSANRVKFTVLPAANAVRVPILPVYEQPPIGAMHPVVGHMPALNPQATLVFRLPAGRWESLGAANTLHVQVSPCRAADLPENAKAVRRIEQALCLRQRIQLDGQSVWFAPASRFGAAQITPLQQDESVWRVWAVVALDDDEST